MNFRRALGWAIDKPQIVKIAYAGLAKPADTPIPPGTGGSTAGWHWTPPAADAVGFDLQKAAAMLDAAGYPLKNGVRVDKKGKPIELRLWARSESLTSQKAGKLIAGWFGQLGLKIDFQIMDEGAMSDKLYNYQGNTYVPDYDMYLWDVVGYTGPGRHAGPLHHRADRRSGTTHAGRTPSTTSSTSSSRRRWTRRPGAR